MIPGLRALRRWRIERRLKRHAIADADWNSAFSQLPLLHRLDAAERQRLRQLVTLFIAEKRFIPLQGLEMTRTMALTIALQACLPIVNLPRGARGGMEWYRGWQTILVYPSAFRVARTEMDEYGIAHEMDDELAGESWEQAGVILSWQDTARAGQLDGYNLVIHEFAHKLDMLNGSADGCPPLPKTISPQQWTSSFSRAFERFNRQLADMQMHGDGNTTASCAIDPYAASTPAEFFAVLSEYFFERPDILNTEFPEVYRLLTLFYRQDPLTGLSA